MPIWAPREPGLLAIAPSPPVISFGTPIAFARLQIKTLNILVGACLKKICILNDPVSGEKLHSRHILTIHAPFTNGRVY
jgi:hypothetical protein